MSSAANGTRLVNYLRASISHGRGRHALEEVRQTASPAQYRTLIATAYRVPNRGRYQILPEFQQRPRAVLTLAPYTALELRREIEWSVALLERHAEKLIPFLQLSLELQRHLLASDESAAVLLIDDVQKRFGWSAWTVQAKIALLQATDGQDAQKKYVADILTENTGLLRAIAHLASQRNEGPVGISGFKLRAADIISGWDIPDAWTTFLKHTLLGDIPQTDGGIADVLTTASSGTCIDLATALIDIVAVHRERLASLNPNAIARLDRLLARLAPIDEGILATSLTSARATLDSSVASNSVFNRAVVCLSSILNRGADAAERQEELEKISLNFAFSPFFRFAGRLSGSLASSAPLRISDLQKEAAFRFCEVVPSLWGTENAAYHRSEDLLTRLEVDWQCSAPDELFSICGALDEGDSFDIASSAKARFAIHLSQGDWQSAIGVAISCIAQFPGSRYEFPFSDAIEGRTWNELRGCHDPVITALAASYAVNEIPPGRDAQKLHRHLQQLALIVLRSSNVQHFSELFQEPMTPVQQQFLADVCVESVIEVNINLDSSKALATERMKICQRLVQSDSGNSTRYLDEIRQLTYATELEEGIRNFDSSRLFVNEAGLQEWGARSLAEDYARYRLLQSASLPELGDIKAAAVSALRDRESPFPQALFEQPKTEADRLLLDLTQRVLREFLYGPTSGLNSYLSLRIRHGSLAGHLRGPLEEAGAIALRDSTSGIYQPISTWQSVGIDLTIEGRSNINSAFDEFSKRFDDRISHFVDELLQIRSEAKPSGVFDISISTLLLNLLKAQTAGIVEPQEFVQTCVSNFKASLSPAMERVRKHIAQIKDEVGRDADRLLESIQCESMDGQLSPLLDAINRGRTNFNFAADRVSDWFSTLDRADHGRRYSLEQIIRIGLTLTTNTRPSFFPELRVELGNDIPLFTPHSGAFLIADAMFIAFDNACLHSRLDGNLRIEVRANLIDGKLLVFEVENDVSEDAETSTVTAKLEKIRGQLESGEYRNMVSAEGGTGLFKLKRLTERSGAVDELTFGFEDGRFKVRFAIPVRSIELPGEAT